VCELLGMVSNVRADLVFSFTGFALRGGQTGPHADGWGVSFYEGPFARTFLEPHPAFSSPLARFLRENPIQTSLAVAHIRKMTRGGAAIANTHPFVRVLHGRHLVFAHNGTLPGVYERALRHESTIGQTDSEHAFCVIVEQLRARYAERYPEQPEELGRVLFDLGNELGSDGVFNFLLADGQCLYARCGDNLSSIVRRPPLGSATLVDSDLRADFNQIMGEGPNARMAVVSTEPLTRDEKWIKATPGTLWVFGHGELLASFEA
jgi:predicted glutamine amidotransferase